MSDEKQIERDLQLLWVLGHKHTGIQPGSFYTRLIKAALHADSINLDKLELGFPRTAGAVKRYFSGQIYKDHNLTTAEWGYR